jgi:hypothetical protein
VAVVVRYGLTVLFGAAIYRIFGLATELIFINPWACQTYFWEIRNTQNPQSTELYGGRSGSRKQISQMFWQENTMS